MAVGVYPTKAYLIDTTVYSHAMRGGRWAANILEEAAHLGISVVSIGELLAGFKTGRKVEENRKMLNEFLDHLQGADLSRHRADRRILQ